MDPLNEEQIGKLLRLKKYEQPPPGYFDNFLHEFHRRQRDELLKEPIAIDGDGMIALPQRPGLGIELDRDAVERYRSA